MKKRERAGMGMKISRVSESKLKEMCISNLKHCKNCYQLLFVSAFFNNVVIVQVSAVLKVLNIISFLKFRKYFNKKIDIKLSAKVTLP